MNNLKIHICYIHFVNGNKIPFNKYSENIVNAYICNGQYMLIDGSKYIFFDVGTIYEYMTEKMNDFIKFNEKYPNIDELLFNGTRCFTKGELISNNPRRECNISIHRYGIDKFLFIVSTNEKIVNLIINKYDITEKNCNSNRDTLPISNKNVLVKKRKLDEENNIKPMFYLKK